MTNIRNNKNSRELFRAILTLKTPDECLKFFRDLLTEDELEEFTDRWQIAQLLEKGLTYREVSKLTGASTTTVTRVAKFLKGEHGGYRKAIERLKVAANS